MWQTMCGIRLIHAFVCSMYSLVLIPLTLWRLGGGSGEEAEVRAAPRPWRLLRARGLLATCCHVCHTVQRSVEQQRRPSHGDLLATASEL